jgi:acyl dehydratase
MPVAAGPADGPPAGRYDAAMATASDTPTAAPVRLIPPETAARVGELLAGPVTVTITAEGAQRYAQAVGDLNPVYFDEAAARAAGHPTLVIPPTYVAYALVQGRPLDSIGVDGLFVGAAPLRLEVARMMFGGEEWDVVRPVHVGERITAETRLAAVDQKDGSKGPFVRVTRETTYRDEAGEVVTRTRQIGIAR